MPLNLNKLSEITLFKIQRTSFKLLFLDLGQLKEAFSSYLTDFRSTLFDLQSRKEKGKFSLSRCKKNVVALEISEKNFHFHEFDY
jgi:hypothetical protein